MEFAFAEIQALSVQDYSLENYTALLLVLDTREEVSNTRDRLRYGFLAHGTTIGEDTESDDSKIYLGSSLCD